MWGVAGRGSGAVLLTPGRGPALESGLAMGMAAGGVRGELVGGGAGGFGLAFKADALWVTTATGDADGPAGRLKAAEAAVTRFRTALEGSRSLTFAGGLSLKPSVELGLRRDGGDAETGAGLDVGGGLVVADATTGLSADIRARMLLVHEAEGFRERGVSVSLGYQPTPSSPLGFSARAGSSWGGRATGGAEALWREWPLANLAAYGGPASGRMDADVSYGLPMGSHLIGTPTIGFESSERGRAYRLGYRLAAPPGGRLHFDLGIDARRLQSPILGADHGVLGRATVSW